MEAALDEARRRGAQEVTLRVSAPSARARRQHPWRQLPEGRSIRAVQLRAEWTPEDATFAHVDLSALFAALGLLMIWAGWASARGRLRRNYVIGMRTRTIMRSDATWRAAHQKCAWSFWSSGCVMVATSALVVAVRPSQQWTVVLWILMTGYLLVAVLLGFAQADREARTVHQR